MEPICMGVHAGQQNKRRQKIAKFAAPKPAIDSMSPEKKHSFSLINLMTIILTHYQWRLFTMPEAFFKISGLYRLIGGKRRLLSPSKGISSLFA